MPEEINRVVADHLSAVLFAPTRQAIENLKCEGIDTARCHCVGDVMFDASLQYRAVAAAKSAILRRLDQVPGRFALLTVHRQENTDDLRRLQVIVAAAEKVAANLPVVWPVHPRTRKAIAQGLGRAVAAAQLHQIDPVGYLDMLMLESSAAVIATDSGGVQKEAFFFEVPCVTLREETEWTELVDLGWNVLAAPTDVDAVASCILGRIGVRGRAASPYGTGKAARAIAEIVASTCASF
jgi:UDP-GlcNAc3NAcA epimerase